MEQRPASRTVTAYARGLYLAQVFQLAVAAIAIIAVIIGGYMVSQQRTELETLRGEVDTAKIELETARAESGKRLAFNDRLIALGSLIAGIDPSDPSGYSAGLTALEELQKDYKGDLAQPTWQEASQRLAALRVNLLEASQQVDAAAAAQAEFLASLGEAAPNSGYIRLATLQCKRGDFTAAQAVITDHLSAADPGEFNDGAFQDACAGRLTLPAVVAPPPLFEENIDKSIDDIPAPGADGGSRGPASAPEVVAISEIERVYLHIREPGQRAAAARVARDLCDAGFRMPGIEAVTDPRPYPKTPRVIYYYADQSGPAGEIGSLVSSIAGNLGLRAWDIDYDLRLYRAEGLPRDRVEIWFPEGTELSSETVDVKFSCGP